MDDQPIKPRLDAQTAKVRPHVLIISDEPELTTFLTEGLPLGGFWTSVIASGLQALEVFRLRQFDIVLLDADLGNFRASEFLRRLRGVSDLDANAPVRTQAPVVVLSSHEMNDPQLLREDLGIMLRMQAPIELDDLVRELHEAFARWQQDHPEILLADSSARRAR